MGKLATDAVLDGTLDIIATATEMYVCTGEPTSRANADSLSLIAAHTLTSGDFSKSDDAVNSGRKITVAQQASLSIDATGTATHIALCTGSDLLYVTTCTSQALTSGGTVTVPAFDITIEDPT